MKITSKNINRVKFEYNITQMFKTPTDPIFNEKNWKKGHIAQIVNEYFRLKIKTGCFTAIRIRKDEINYTLEQLELFYRKR